MQQFDNAQVSAGNIQSSPLEPLFDERQAGDILGFSRTTMHKLRTTGQIDFVIVSDRWIRYSTQQLQAFMTRNTPKTKIKK